MGESNQGLHASELFGVKGKVALVTGGSRGIGLMMARGLVANGAIVFISARKRSECEKTAAALTSMGPGKCYSLPADLSSDAACRQLAIQLAQHTDRLDILVNNAGATWGADFEEFPEEAWSKIMTLNVTSVFNLTRACLKLLEAASGGKDSPSRVINISSVMGHSTDPTENTYSYGASKAALSHLTRVLAAQLTPRGITVNAIAPGVFPSKMTAYMFEGGETPQAVVDKHPIGRVGKEADMAGAVVFLCSPAGAFVSGTVLPMDGGYLIGKVGSPKL